MDKMNIGDGNKTQTLQMSFKLCTKKIHGG